MKELVVILAFVAALVGGIACIGKHHSSRLGDPQKREAPKPLRVDKATFPVYYPAHTGHMGAPQK